MIQKFNSFHNVRFVLCVERLSFSEHPVVYEDVLRCVLLWTVVHPFAVLQYF